MKTKTLHQTLATLACLATLALGTTVRADTFAPLNAGDAVVGPTYAGLTAGPFSGLTGGSVVASTSAAITVTGYTGVFGTTVLSGVTQNAHGLNKLTFVYEFQTLTALPAVGLNLHGQGISNTTVFGWNNSILADFAMGSQFFFGSGGTPVLPLYAARFFNGEVHFGFPLDDNGPPIFAGENSYQMILFTDATTYAQSTGTVQVTDYNLGSAQYASGLSTLVGSAPVAVPDGSTTTVLLGLSLISLTVFGRRSKRS